jgi:hypothetical protein
MSAGTAVRRRTALSALPVYMKRWPVVSMGEK